MKELSIEEKAKRYDEAIKVAKSKIKNDKDHVLYEDDIIEIFPELKESEDERICRKLIAFLKQCKAVYGDGFKQFDLNIDDAIAWLEKQSEKPIIEMKTPEESLGIDSDTYNKIVDECIYGDDKQKPAAWSKEDDIFFKAIIRDIENIPYISEDAKKDRKNWLKSLRPRSQWKPSKEQMEALWNVYRGGKEQVELATLYNDLKKLREE